mmetsp:Transcript_16222/g.27448  ORF Transcript_16222/g.27448 Transcript_16222/m.27448 type:complete len:120 (+) Transcript_16222:763-1122(+)
MFTSRSEYRLMNRAENSDFRLTQLGIDLGIISDEQTQAFKRKQEAKEKAVNFLQSFSMTSKKWNDRGVSQASPQKSDKLSAFKLLSYAGATLDSVEKGWLAESDFKVDPIVRSHVFVDC